MTTTVQPTIAITMGDPVGIGPEIIVKVLADQRPRKPARSEMLARAAGRAVSPKKRAV
jgi:4-hydroxy-L-threonine phosphate dehydrogenase PdxA